MANPEEVLAYWLDDLGPKGWYRGGKELDEEIRKKFGDTWKQAKSGALGLWLTYPTGTLAYLIVTDQFSRNLFRGKEQAFSTDRAARAAAKAAISRGWDLRIDGPARLFFYLPLMHSENLCDQDRAVRLMLTRMPGENEGYLLHAKAHREVIRQFGRFPYRNKALGRETTPAEAEFLEQGAYGAVVEAMKSKQAA